jgi:hypothetical protein
VTINSTAIWRVRKLGSNVNGGGYDPAISGAGTDYSQQDAAQAAGTNGTASGTTTFSDAIAGAFTAAMVGNSIYLAGSGFTAGFYFILAYVGPTAVTLDRSPGTGTAATWSLGGGWSDPFANIPSVVAGNAVYIRGAGSDRPTVDDYALGSGATVNVPSGNFTVGNVRFIGENGRPRISANNSLYNVGACNSFAGLYLAANGPGAGTTGFIYGGGSSTCYLLNCVFDQNGNDVTMSNTVVTMIGGEIFSSVAPSSNGSNYAIHGTQESLTMRGVNIHDTVGHGIQTFGRLGSSVKGNLIVKCRGDGLTLLEDTGLDQGSSAFFNNTIDGNLGHGIVISGVVGLQQSSFMNNIISNHAGSGKYGIYCNFGALAANDRIKGYHDFNAYFGNANDLLGVSHGADDIVGTDPEYAAQSTEGYNLGSNLKAKGTPQAAFQNSSTAFTPTATKAYIDIGGVQRQEPISPVGTINYTESNDSNSAQGDLNVSGTISGADASDTNVTGAVVSVQGSIAATEQSDANSSSGDVGNAVAGNIATVEQSDVNASTGVAVIVGNISDVESTDANSATGTVTTSVSGNAQWTESNDVNSMAGNSAVVSVLQQNPRYIYTGMMRITTFIGRTTE